MIPGLGLNISWTSIYLSRSKKTSCPHSGSVPTDLFKDHLILILCKISNCKMMLKRMSGKYVVNHQDDDDDDIVDHKDDHDGQGVDQQDEHHDDIVDLKDDHDGYVVDHKMNMMMRNDVHLLLEREAAIEPHHLNLGLKLQIASINQN